MGVPWSLQVDVFILEFIEVFKLRYSFWSSLKSSSWDIYLGVPWSIHVEIFILGVPWSLQVEIFILKFIEVYKFIYLTWSSLKSSSYNIYLGVPWSLHVEIFILEFPEVFTLRYLSWNSLKSLRLKLKHLSWSSLNSSSWDIYFGVSWSLQVEIFILEFLEVSELKYLSWSFLKSSRWDIYKANATFKGFNCALKQNFIIFSWISCYIFQYLMFIDLPSCLHS